MPRSLPVSVCTASEVCIPLRECPSLRSKVGVSRSEAERASVLRLIGSRLCGQGEIGQNLDVCCDRTDASAAAAPTRQEGFEFKVIYKLRTLACFLDLNMISSS